MKDNEKSRDELIEEVKDLRNLVSKLRDSKLNLRYTERALRKEEKEKEAILNSMWEEVFYLDPTLRIIWANRESAESTNMNPEDLVGRDAREVFDCLFDTDKKNPLIRTLSSNRPEREEIKSNNEKTMLVSSYPIFDERGNIDGIVGTCLDITDRKKAEEKLKESERKYKTIFENIGTPTIIIDKNKTISLTNKEFEKLTGYSKDMVENKMSWTHFVIDKDIERLEKYHEKRREDPNSVPKYIEFSFVDKYDNVKKVLAKIALIPGTDQSVASVIDIKENDNN